MKRFLQFGGFLAILGNFGIVLLCMAIIFEFFRWQEWDDTENVLIFLFLAILLISGAMSIFFITKILLIERSVNLSNQQILDLQPALNANNIEFINTQLWGFGNLIFGILIIGFGIYMAVDSRGNSKLLGVGLICLYGLFILTIQLVFKKYQKKIIEGNSGEGWNRASE